MTKGQKGGVVGPGKSIWVCQLALVEILPPEAGRREPCVQGWLEQMLSSSGSREFSQTVYGGRGLPRDAAWSC